MEQSAPRFAITPLQAHPHDGKMEQSARPGRATQKCFILYFVTFDALLAGHLVPYKWNQAWQLSKVIGA